MHRTPPAGQVGGADSGRMSLRWLIVFSTGAVFLAVLVSLAFLLGDRVVEELKLRTVEKGAPEEQAEALAWLLERGSLRALPYLLDQVLDPALERRLEETVHAIHALRAERTGRTETEDPWPILRPRDDFREIKFTGVDRDSLDFIRSPDLRPAVHFGCVITPAPYDKALEAALGHGSPAIRAQALAVLLRVNAPASVQAQWSALQTLKRSRLPGRWDTALARISSSFEPSALLTELAIEPPADNYSSPRARFEWSIRAAGVTRLGAALPHLRRLSISSNLHTALSAERSLEDFAGAEADEALAHCLLGWQNASFRAGEALCERNKPYLNQILSGTSVPPGCRYEQAILLARVGNRDALPLLVSEVQNVAMIDGEIFEHIERLADERHRDLIRSLPDRVRSEQAEAARAVVGRFEERFPSAADREGED